MPNATQTSFTLRWAPFGTTSWSAAQTFAAWGLAKPRFRFVSQQPSALTFVAEGLAVDAAPLFPFKAQIQVYKTTVTATGTTTVSYFVGVVTQTPSQGSPNAERQTYTVLDVWWYLDQIVYRQQWVLSLSGQGAVFGTPTTATVGGVTGVVTGIPVVTPGGNAGATPYHVGDLIFIQDVPFPPTMPTGYGGVGQVTAIDGNGGITTTKVLQGGNRYTAPMAGNPSPYRSHCFLNPWVFTATSSSTGVYAPRTTRYEILDVFTFLNYAASQTGFNVPIQQPSSIPSDADFIIPTTEIRDQVCGEVLRSQLRYQPDAVTWFDYTATRAGQPSPRLNVARQADMVASASFVNLGLGGGPAVSSLQVVAINPRYDLQVPCVQIAYEYNNQVTEGGNTSTWQTLFTDTFPPVGFTGLEVSSIVATVALQGLDLNNVTANLLTGRTSTLLPTADISGNSWWRSKIGPLASMVSGSATLISMAFTDLAGNPTGPGATWADVTAWAANLQGVPASGPGSWGGPLSELISGQVAPWMVELSSAPNPGPIGAFDVLLTAVVNFKQNNPSPGQTPGTTNAGPVLQQGNQVFHLRLRLTSARLPDVANVANQYFANSSWAFPEVYYQGLAKAIYQSRGQDTSFGGIGLQYDGTVECTEGESFGGAGIAPVCSGFARPGQVLNLVNSANAAWSTMMAPIQIVEEDLETGKTTITFGTPRHLGVQDLITLRSINRWRITLINPAAQLSAQQDQTNTQLGQQTAISDSTAGVIGLQSMNPLAAWPAGGGPLPAGQGLSLATVPDPTAAIPAAVKHPAQGTGGAFGSGFVAFGVGGSPPVPKSTTPVPAGQLDANGNPVNIAAFLADLVDGTGTYHSPYFIEIIITDPDTCVQKKMKVLGTDPY